MQKFSALHLLWIVPLCIAVTLVLCYVFCKYARPKAPTAEELADRPRQLDSILRPTLNALRRHGIRHYADGGTLLGLARSGDYIPHDDDIDIQILEPDFKARGKEALRALRSKGLCARVDVFGVLRVSNGKYTLDGVMVAPKDGGKYHSVPWYVLKPFPARLVGVPRLAKFRGIQIPIPERTAEFLQLYYSGDFMEVSAVTHSHDNVLGYLHSFLFQRPVYFPTYKKRTESLNSEALPPCPLWVAAQA